MSLYFAIFMHFKLSRMKALTLHSSSSLKYKHWLSYKLSIKRLSISLNSSIHTAAEEYKLWCICVMLTNVKLSFLACRLKIILSGQALPKCLTLEMSHKTVRLSVRILSFIICNDEMAVQLCSHECKCIWFLFSFRYKTSLHTWLH